MRKKTHIKKVDKTSFKCQNQTKLNKYNKKMTFLDRHASELSILQFPSYHERLFVSRDIVSYGGLPQTASLVSLGDVEPSLLLCLPAAAARCDRRGGQLRGPAPGTVSLVRRTGRNAPIRNYVPASASISCSFLRLKTSNPAAYICARCYFFKLVYREWRCVVVMSCLK